MLFLVPTLTMCVIGCATVPSNPPPPEIVCPSIIEYTPAFQQRMLEALDMLPSENVLREIVRDYLQLRDRVRVCR